MFDDLKPYASILTGGRVEPEAEAEPDIAEAQPWSLPAKPKPWFETSAPPPVDSGLGAPQVPSAPTARIPSFLPESEPAPRPAPTNPWGGTGRKKPWFPDLAQAGAELGRRLGGLSDPLSWPDPGPHVDGAGQYPGVKPEIADADMGLGTPAGSPGLERSLLPQRPTRPAPLFSPVVFVDGADPKPEPTRPKLPPWVFADGAPVDQEDAPPSPDLGPRPGIYPSLQPGGRPGPVIGPDSPSWAWVVARKAAELGVPPESYRPETMTEMSRDRAPVYPSLMPGWGPGPVVGPGSPSFERARLRWADQHGVPEEVFAPRSYPELADPKPESFRFDRMLAQNGRASVMSDMDGAMSLTENQDSDTQEAETDAEGQGGFRPGEGTGYGDQPDELTPGGGWSVEDKDWDGWEGAGQDPEALGLGAAESADTTETAEVQASGPGLPQPPADEADLAARMAELNSTHNRFWSRPPQTPDPALGPADPQAAPPTDPGLDPWARKNAQGRVTPEDMREGEMRASQVRSKQAWKRTDARGQVGLHRIDQERVRVEGPWRSRVPEMPPGMSVDANIEEANRIAAEIDEQYTPEQADAQKLFWFKSQVASGGPWDVKTKGLQYEAAGNYNYGATAKALGIPDQVADRAAGLYQMGTAVGGKGPFGKGSPLGTRPYGDEWSDNTWIRLGRSHVLKKREQE